MISSAAPASGGALPAIASGWTYDTDTDEMRGSKRVYAHLTSENSISLDPPYDGGPAHLHIRKFPNEGSIVVLTEEGQFDCDGAGDGRIAVKFDAGPVEHFSCLTAADGSTGAIAIQNSSRFIAKMKTAKKLIIEADFFQSGRRQMTFDVAGLQWPPPAT